MGWRSGNSAAAIFPRPCRRFKATVPVGVNLPQLGKGALCNSEDSSDGSHRRRADSSTSSSLLAQLVWLALELSGGNDLDVFNLLDLKDKAVGCD